MQELTTEEEKKSLIQRLRASVLPIKPTDNVVVKLGKNAGFVLFMIMFSFVSLAIVLAVTLAM